MLYKWSLLPELREKKVLLAGLICPHLLHFFTGSRVLLYSYMRKSSVAFATINLGILFCHREEIYSGVWRIPYSLSNSLDISSFVFLSIL